ncbi:APC family permease [Affinibrenneria salicis]|uniref:APC family permease n=2 Tax=Affinibrenneria salicis TaxID=2590031 RepID=A0A5J5FUX3_9GAMM|nr:APC family permease [Affinibrenneria salicis]
MTSGELKSSSGKLSGTLGVTSIVLMVVATAAPLTVMVANTPLIISMGNGAAAPFDAIIATAIMLLFTIGFVAMSKYITNAGAFYAYVQKGLGRIIGLGSASTALVSYSLILFALEAYIGYSLAEFLSSFFSISIPWQIMSFVVVAIIGFLGYRHIELSSKFLAVALVLEILIVLLVDAAILYRQGVPADAFTAFSPATISSGSPGLGIMFAIYCFIGFEATVIFREEARDPERTIPLATYIAVLLVGLFYTLSMWCEVIGVGVQEVLQFANAHPADMYLLITENYLNRAFVDVMQVLLITSLFACILSLHNIVVRYQYVMGRYGVLSNRLSGVHQRHASPHASSLVQTLTSLGMLAILMLIGLDPVTQIYAWGATAGTLGYMLILSLTCISVLVFFQRNKVDRRLWNVVIAPAGGLAGILICLWIAVDNLPSLVGGDNAHGVSIALETIVLLTFIAGIACALYMKACRPVHYQRLKELA